MNKLILERPLAFFDLETTGKTIDSRIVEICIIKLLPEDSDGWHKREALNIRINPVIEIPPAATAVHGIKNEDLLLCPTFKDVAVQIFQFIKGCDLAGYNSNRFDIPVLNQEFDRAGIVWNYREVRMIDSCVVFKRNNARTLAAAYRHYTGEELKNAHNSVADVEATIEIFLNQINTHPDLPNTIDALHLYSNYDQPVLDLSGWFGLDDDGDYIFMKGKFRNEKAKLHKPYLEWMKTAQSFTPTETKPSFSDDVKVVVSEILATIK